MKTEKIEIRGIPAVLYGEPCENVWLFIHGKLGCKEEGEAFAAIACPSGVQVLSVDLPEHGARKEMRDAFNPWTVVPELQSVMAYLQMRWKKVSLRANSIGAFFSMLAYREENLRKALFVSPIIDMEKLIGDMLIWAGVTEAELRERGEIPTAFGETLSWRYLAWVREHPIKNWRCPTSILYAGLDNLTSRETVDAFVKEYHAAFTVLEDGEHWFHTPEQLEALAAWERENL